MKFTPHEDYECLKKQAHALARVVACKEQIEQHYRERANPQAAKTIERLRAELDSERSMNALLTEENQELRAKLELYEI